MKKLTLVVATIATISLMSFTINDNNEKNTSENTEVSSSFKLVNDTGEKVKISHKGGSVSLNNGGSTSISCDEGKEISVNGKVTFEVSSDMCGKTIKLSKYM
jgi:hypothetical protein